MKSATSLTPPRTGLGCTQFSILNVLESFIPKDKKKYNNAEMKSGRLFTAATALDTRCCEYKNSGEKSIHRAQPNQNKENKLQTRFFVWVWISSSICLGMGILAHPFKYFRLFICGVGTVFFERCSPSLILFFYCVCSWEIMKSVTSLMSRSTGLSGT